MIFAVKRRTHPGAVDADWCKPAWQGIEPARLEHFMGDRPAHFPDTRVKLACDDEALYVIFRVKDRFVLGRRTAYQQDVYRDSCVEFFFRPNNDSSENYFNLETNCCGAALFAFQEGPRRGEIRIPAGAFEKVALAHTLNGPVQDEISEPVTWSVEYRLPLDLLSSYCRVDPPAPGVTWKGNFYKIADETSHPHYLTWAPVDRPRPDFHQPRFFGTLEFR